MTRSDFDRGGDRTSTASNAARRRRIPYWPEMRELRRAFALVPPELTHFPASQGMRRRRAAFEAVDVHLASVESTCSHFRSVTSEALSPCRYAIRTMSASRPPCRRFCPAPPRSRRSTSSGRRCSRSRRSSFLGLIGGCAFPTVPFLVAGGTSRRFRLCHDNSAPGDQHSPIYARMAATLDQEVRNEEHRVKIHDPADVAYSTYAKTAAFRAG